MRNTYLFQPAEKWVSTFVLLGCIAITVVLVYTSVQAGAIASKWTDTSMISEY